MLLKVISDSVDIVVINIIIILHQEDDFRKFMHTASSISNPCLSDWLNWYDMKTIN